MVIWDLTTNCLTNGRIYQLVTVLKALNSSTRWPVFLFCLCFANRSFHERDAISFFREVHASGDREEYQSQYQSQWPINGNNPIIIIFIGLGPECSHPIRVGFKRFEVSPKTIDSKVPQTVSVRRKLGFRLSDPSMLQTWIFWNYIWLNTVAFFDEHTIYLPINPC